MEFEWDRAKAESNLRKHGVDFADAVTVLHDGRALTMTEPADDEERHITLGMDAMARVLIVVYTWRGDRIRLISARKATAAERRQYVKRR